MVWSGFSGEKFLYGSVGSGVVWRGVVGSGKVRYGMVSLARNFYKVGLGEARLGWAGRGLAWQGRVGFGLARYGFNYRGSK